MFNFLKKIKNLAVISLSEDLRWLVDIRPELKNIEKLAVLTPPETQRILKRNYKGADIFFKYLDEVMEVVNLCDCAMFIGTSAEIVEGYLKIAKVSNNLKYIIVSESVAPADKAIVKGKINECSYNVYAVPVVLFKSTEKKISIETKPETKAEPKNETKETKPEEKHENIVEAPVKKGRGKK